MRLAFFFVLKEVLAGSELAPLGRFCSVTPSDGQDGGALLSGSVLEEPDASLFLRWFASIPVLVAATKREPEQKGAHEELTFKKLISFFALSSGSSRYVER